MSLLLTLNSYTSHPVNQFISIRCCIAYRTQSFDLQRKSNDWFLYEMQRWVEMGQSSVFAYNVEQVFVC